MTSLFERLSDNEIILLDGGVSTEIQKRGVPMDSDVWSGLAHKSHPEVVLQSCSFAASICGIPHLSKTTSTLLFRPESFISPER